MRKRLVAVLVGTVLALVLLELALQAGALVVEGRRDAGEGAALAVCQGDSNVYGLFLPPELSFPGHLEARLSAAGAEPARVANRGVPGKATWVVRRELPADLARFSPAAYVVMAGTNNLWQPRPADAGALAAEGSPGLELRTVRLARLVLARLRAGPPEAPAPAEDQYFIPPSELEADADGTRHVSMIDRTGAAVSFDLPGGETTLEEVYGGVWEDLEAIVETCRAAGVEPILCCYASDEAGQAVVNGIVVEVAAQTGARLVDPRPWFARALEDLPRRVLLYESAHPTDLGYTIIARLVHGALADAGLAPAPAVDDPLAEVRGWKRPELSVEPVRLEGAVTGFRAKFIPGYGGTVLVSGARGESRVEFGRWMKMNLVPPGEERGFAVPLHHDQVLRQAIYTEERERLLFDADGSVELGLPPLPPPGEGEERWACFVLLSPDHEVLATGEPVRVHP